MTISAHGFFLQKEACRGLCMVYVCVHTHTIVAQKVEMKVILEPVPPPPQDWFLLVTI